MRRTHSFAWVGLLAATLAAQGDKTAAAPTPKPLQALIAELDAATAQYRTAVEKLTNSDEFKAARDAKDNDKLQALQKQLPNIDHKAFGERALKLADGFAGEEQLQALIWAAKNGFETEILNTVIDRVQAAHVKSPNLVGLLESYGLFGRADKEKVQKLLAAVEKDNPNALARAWALYAHAQLLAGREASAEDKAKAEAMTKEAEQLAPGSPLAARIAAPRFEKERLQIGMTVPEIEGKDTDGVAFKLSDYRGKVVVVDFWGFW